ncbi:MAG: SusF/SusE family outer membrane protein [Sphingobacteriaceae bacterium]|nr:MAG: SusF/SusE family outer membrane protein [Sphingobacteriaceae bacterium]
MKSYIFKSMMFGVIALMLWSCKKDETRIVVTENPKAPVVAATFDELILDESNGAADVLMLEWDKSEYGYNASINYTIEIGKKDSSFTPAVSVNMGNSLERIFTVAQLNALVNQLNVVGFEENELELRVKSEIGGGVAPAYSNVISITVTPYLDKPPYQTLYLVGDATPNGWNNSTDNPPTAVYRNPTDPFLFTFTGYFNAGSFKYLSKPGAWAPMWGITDGAVAFRATESDPDPGSFQIATAGYYTVTLNLKNTTHTIVPYAGGASAPVNTEMGIIGPFTGWGSIIEMTRPANNPHHWTLVHTFTDAETEFKFRTADNSWAVNFGAESDALQNEVYGVGKGGGSNFKIAAGTYTIIFNDMTREYVFIKQD